MNCGDCLLNRRLTDLAAAARVEAGRFPIPKQLPPLVKSWLRDSEGSSWDAALRQITGEIVEKGT
jgi:hypothetical protein